MHYLILEQNYFSWGKIQQVFILFSEVMLKQTLGVLEHVDRIINEYDVLDTYIQTPFLTIAQWSQSFDLEQDINRFLNDVHISLTTMIVYITISLIVSLMFKSALLYQTYLQRKLKNIGIESYYVPLIFVYKNWSRKSTQSFIIKSLPLIKTEFFTNKEMKRKFKEIIFQNYSEDMEIKDINKSLMKGWNYIQIKLVQTPQRQKESSR